MDVCWPPDGLRGCVLKLFFFLQTQTHRNYARSYKKSEIGHLQIFTPLEGECKKCQKPNQLQQYCQMVTPYIAFFNLVTIIVWSCL